MWEVVDIDLWLGRSNGCDSVVNFFFAFFSQCAESIEISVFGDAQLSCSVHDR